MLANGMKSTSAEKDTVHEVRRVTYAGMVVNIVIAVLKGCVGVVFSSQALLADAVHSLSDLVTDVAVVSIPTGTARSRRW